MLSIIIPAHNEEALLPRTIAAARDAAEAMGHDYEIILVNDASTDRTGPIAREMGARVIDSNRRQIAAVRNEGASEARGEWFVFVDGDTEMTRDVLAAARSALDAGAIGGGCAVRFDGEVPLYARLLMPMLVTLFRWTRNATGCFIYCTREAFEAAGGFDERFFASEEIHMSRALKKQGRFVVLREEVISSGRKLRQYRARFILWTIFRQALRGPWRAWRDRKGLEIWYDSPRETTKR